MKVAFKAVLAGVFAIAMIAGCTNRGERGPASTGDQDSSGASAASTPSSGKSSSKSGGGM